MKVRSKPDSKQRKAAEKTSLQKMHVQNVDEIDTWPLFEVFSSKQVPARFPVVIVSLFFCSLLPIQSNLCTTTTLGTQNLWLLLTGGRCSEVALCYQY